MRNGQQGEEPIVCEPGEPSPNGRGACGERALMRAVLVDAIRCITGRAGGGPERTEMAREARQWIEDRDLKWPFSFENICLELGIDTERLRTTLVGMAAELPLEGAPARRVRAERPREEDIEALIRAGQPLRLVAERFGISVAQVSTLSSGLATRLRRQRDEEIVRLNRCGWSHAALAKHFGLSRIRVRRICAAADRHSPGRRPAEALASVGAAPALEDPEREPACPPPLDPVPEEETSDGLWLSETASWPDGCDTAP